MYVPCVPTGLIGRVAFFCRLSQAFLSSLSPRSRCLLFTNERVLARRTRGSLPAFPLSYHFTADLRDPDRKIKREQISPRPDSLFPPVTPDIVQRIYRAAPPVK